MIEKIEGLTGLVNLKNLDLQQNCLTYIDDLQELLQLPALQSLDLKNNQIDDRDKVLPFFKQMPQIHALYLKGNPCVRFMSKYRKTLTETLPQLNYLDERPIFDHERMVADAFVRGGDEEVKRVKEEAIEKKLDEKKRMMDDHKTKMVEGRKKRKLQLKNMLEELKDEKSEMIEKRENLKAEMKSIPENMAGDRNRVKAKIMKIDADL